MKIDEFELQSLNKEESLLINGGSCSCPDCAGGMIGRTIGRFIKFWATVEYGRMPLA